MGSRHDPPWRPRGRAPDRSPRRMSTMPASEQQITEEIRETALQVSAAQDRVEERDVVAATHVAVERLSGRYREYFDSLSDGEKMKAERTLGRRMADIKRLASLLPRIGTAGGGS